jgi:hypothetical protein
MRRSTPRSASSATSRSLRVAVAYLTAEDFYHAGQLAFIRMATDPGWDYFGSIYGGDG